MAKNRSSYENLVENRKDCVSDKTSHKNLLFETAITNDDKWKLKCPSKIINSSASYCTLTCHVKPLQVSSKSDCYMSQMPDCGWFSKDIFESSPKQIKNLENFSHELWNSSKLVELSDSGDKNSADSNLQSFNSKHEKSSLMIDNLELECSDVVAELLTLPEKHSCSNSNYKEYLSYTKDYSVESYLGNPDDNYINKEDTPCFPILQVHRKEKLAVECMPKPKKTSKKDKRNKQKFHKNMPLEDFFLNPDEAVYIEPEIDEFLESIIYKNKRNDSTRLSSFAFPPLTTEKQITFEPCNEFHKNKRSQLDVGGTDYSLEETTKSDLNCFGKIHIEKTTSIRGKVLVIENIPLSVDEQMLKSLLSVYGVIKYLNMTRLMKSSNAELSIDVDDLGWVIDSLDGSQPFGDSSESLRCYERSEEY